MNDTDKKPAHGGNLVYLAGLAGCEPHEIVDFSANMNPLGPPEWFRREVSARLSELVHYPDPDCRELIRAASERYGAPEDNFFPCNGTSDGLHLLPRVFDLKRAVLPAPAYVDYEKAVTTCGLHVTHILLEEKRDFRLDFEALDAALQGGPALVILGRPNNPTGRSFRAEPLRELAAEHPDSVFVVDEAFADFAPDMDRLVANRPENVVVLLSLTKFYALPGIRLGLVAAGADVVTRLKGTAPAWSVNMLAQALGARALRDEEYIRESRDACQRLRNELYNELVLLPGLTVFPGDANYLFCRSDREGLDARTLFEKLLEKRIAIRVCDNYAGLDARYFRVAVRGEEDNARLVDALAEIFQDRPQPKPRRRTPALMFQGTCSDAGKSVLAAAMCRILLQDGFRVAPFKAQNMSLNSFVTADGGEMGRAQVTQAAACRLAPDVRMNPVLLKPSSDTGSQVIVMGRPIGSMRVGKYIGYKAAAFDAAKRAYDSLAEESDVMVLEGAGSPAEINLKAHDIVNMNMARYANADVLLVSDIDRGGSYASLIGTMECLNEWERRLVKGFVLNKFRGDASLLAPANEQVLAHTGVPVIGVVPYAPGHGLPEEDSVSFKAGRLKKEKPGETVLDIALIDLAHISNFTDFDALANEKDVLLRTVRRPEELGEPDAVILPGSKNTIGDLARLKEQGFAEALSKLKGKTEIIGICGGFQMLGKIVADPLGLESEAPETRGFGLLPLKTEHARNKTLTLTRGTHAASGCEVRGYEIHHGVTLPLDETVLDTVLVKNDGSALGVGLQRERVWGTYLHGVFDADGFRRAFLDNLRALKGLPPLGTATPYDLDPALDRMAQLVREAIDMDFIYRLLTP